MLIFTKKRTIEILKCRIGCHDFQVEYRSAPGILTVMGKEYEIQGTVERCQREGCNRLFFTYEDWPRMECREDSAPRRFSPSQREGRVLVVA